jgi:hypothetical protein
MSKQLTFDEITEFMATGKGTHPKPPEPPEVLTPDSLRWEMFIEGLESWLSECGCDGDSGEHVHRRAKAVMHKMGGINIDASLNYFESEGGYCDCEIVLNVAWK